MASLRVLRFGLCLMIAVGGVCQAVSQELSRRQGGRDSEVEALAAGTHLAREVIGEHDTAEVLRRVLQRSPYEELTPAEYLALLESTVKEFPESRVAREALANTLIGHSESGPDFERGVQELKRAAELSFRDGTVRYQAQLPYYLAITGDEEGLHRYAEQAFALIPEERERYTVYLYYANALARLKSPRTDEMFKRAIAARPTGQWAPYEFYSTYLRETKQYERLLELLSPTKVRESAFLQDVFQAARCEALQALGRRQDAKSECGQGKVKRAEHVQTVGSNPGGGVKVDYPHNSNQPDDCRFQSGCLYHPQCSTPGFCVCYNAFVWNLAEVALNEAGGEAPGSQNSVAWTARNRAIRMSTPGCGGFPGANTGCTSGCPWPSQPQACELQKKYCCVIHASNQFNRTHIPTANIPYHVLENMRRVVDGQLPDPVSGYLPQGAAGCPFNNCDGFTYCNTPGGSFDAAPLGSIYFYGNSATGFQCRSAQPGIGIGCAIVSSETCGNSTDGSGSDNCYLRSTRVRTWGYSDLSCGSSCSNFSTQKMLNAGGYTYKIPSETPRFNAPGGKHFDVTMGLQSGSPSTVNVRLLRSDGSLLYDFGTITVSSSTLATFPFESFLYVPASGIGDQLRVVNNGPGVVKLTTVVSYD